MRPGQGDHLGIQSQDSLDRETGEWGGLGLVIFWFLTWSRLYPLACFSFTIKNRALSESFLLQRLPASPLPWSPRSPPCSLVLSVKGTPRPDVALPSLSP